MSKMKNLEKLGITLVSAVTLMSVMPVSNIMNMNTRTIVNASAKKRKVHSVSYDVLLRNRHSAHKLVRSNQAQLRHLRHQIKRVRHEHESIVVNNNYALKHQLKLNVQHTKKWAHQLMSPKHNSNAKLRSKVAKKMYYGYSISKRWHHDKSIARLIYDSHASYNDRLIAHRLSFDADSMLNLDKEYKKSGVRHYSSKKAHAKHSKLRNLRNEYNSMESTLKFNMHKYHKAQRAVKHYKKVNHIYGKHNHKHNSKRSHKNHKKNKKATRRALVKHNKVNKKVAFAN